MDIETILTIVSLALTVSAGLLGKKWTDALAKGEKITQLLNDIIVAAKDKAVTEEEFQKIASDAKAVVAVVQ